MRSHRPIVCPRGGWVVFVVWAGLWAAPAGLAGEPAASDAVEALRQALRTPMGDPVKDPKLLKARLEELTKRVDAVRSLGDLRQALMLNDWLDEDQDPAVRDVDRTVKAVVAERLEKSLRQVLQTGNTVKRLAALTFIREMGVGIPEISSRRSLARRLAPDLAALVISKEDPEVVAAAAQALGQINPDAKMAISALGSLLQAKDVHLRQAAAGALCDLVKYASQTTPIKGGRGQSTRTVETSPDQLIQTGLIVAPVASKGLAQEDAEVRRRCLEALRYTAEALTNLAPDLPSNPPLNEEIHAYFAEARTKLFPLAQVLNRETAPVAGVLTDANLKVRLAANEVLEATASARLVLLRLAAQEAAAAGANKPLEDPLREGLAHAVPALVKELADGEVRVRLGALYVLETLQTLVVPVTADVVEVLRDPDPFVRWGAARTLGKMVPADKAKPSAELAQAMAKAAPELGRSLDDDNRDVRITAAAALQRYGPAARPAAAAAGRLAQKGDAEMRVLAIGVLAAIGGEAGAEAVPALVKALGDPVVDVRQAAAGALARFRPATPEAVAALRKALTDSNPGVRQAASDTLLADK